eukprot:2002177-Prymnesium_polylepis.1
MFERATDAVQALAPGQAPCQPRAGLMAGMAPGLLACGSSIYMYHVSRSPVIVGSQLRTNR